MSQLFFETLNEALQAEGLVESWEVHFDPIQYGETRTWTWEDGSRYGRRISVYRNEQGRYERPVHYAQ